MTRATPHFFLRWQASVGGLHSRSPILDGGDVIFVASCGVRWNVRDRLDGVFCLSKKTGKTLWFTPTLSDVNEMVRAGDEIIVPTDLGDVFVIDASTGEIKLIHQADSAVLGRPIVYEGLSQWSAVFASLNGTIYTIDSRSDEATPIGIVEGGVRSALTPLGSRRFLVTTETGQVIKVGMDRHGMTQNILVSAPEGKYGGPVSITSNPLVIGDFAYIGYSRETYYEYPAVFCVNLREEETQWVAFDEGTDEHYGNVRTTPLLIGGKLAVASAYSDSLTFLCPTTGVVLGRVKLGQTVLQQWSSPVAVDAEILAVGRVDGVLSLVDTKEEKLLASVSLATADAEKVARVRPAGEDPEMFRLYPGEPAPDGAICGTPLASGRDLFVGTTDGSIAAIQMSSSK